MAYTCSSGGGLAQACVWSLFLSRHSPRKEEVWATGMEHQGTHTPLSSLSFVYMPYSGLFSQMAKLKFFAKFKFACNSKCVATPTVSSYLDQPLLQDFFLQMGVKFAKIKTCENNPLYGIVPSSTDSYCT